MSRVWSTIGSRRRKALRAKLVERDGPNCFHCQRPTRELPCDGGNGPPDQRTVDHFPIPRCELPPSEWLNPDRTRLACLECNQRLNREKQTQC